MSQSKSNDPHTNSVSTISAHQVGRIIIIDRRRNRLIANKRSSPPCGHCWSACWRLSRGIFFHPRAPPHRRPVGPGYLPAAAAAWPRLLPMAETRKTESRTPRASKICKTRCPATGDASCDTSRRSHPLPSPSSSPRRGCHGCLASYRAKGKRTWRG